MDSPLKYDEAVKKEFGIDDTVGVEPVAFLGLVRTQFEQIQAFLSRERVELMLAEAQKASDVEALAASAAQKVAEHRNNIKGIVASLRVLAKLKDELEASLKG